MKLKILLYTFLSVSTINQMFSQKAKTITDITENQIEIQLYRGIIELSNCDCNAIEIEQKTLDYDSYINNDNESVNNDGKSYLEIERTNGILRIKNEQSRNIQKLIITIPKHITTKIVVDHYGEVVFNSISNELDIQIFQGSIQGGISKAISASIIRDGSIGLQLNSNLFQLAYISIYEGNITLEISKKIDANFNIQTDLGKFKNLIKASMNKTKEAGGEIKVEGKVTNYNTTRYTGFINAQNKNQITLKNAKGDIIIKNKK